MGKKRLSRKVVHKLSNPRCFFCGTSEYSVLDAHRLLPGEDGGKYHDANILNSCSNCHRRCHAGEIVLDTRKYKYTGPGFMGDYWIGGKEYWTPEEKGHYSLSSEKAILPEPPAGEGV